MNDFNEAIHGIPSKSGGLYITNASNADSDGDGLSDLLEITTDREPDIAGIQNTDPTMSDTDGDGMSDYQEIIGVEVWLPGKAVRVKVKTSPLRVDSDGDGLSDGLEILTDFDPQPNEGKQVYLAEVRGATTNETIAFQTKYTESGLVNSTDPRDDDTDDDGMSDGYEYDNSDLDKDGLPTWWEDQFGLNQLSPMAVDTDYDGMLDSEEDFENDALSNLEEYMRRTNPHNDDTNSNGVRDGDESMTVLLPADQNGDGVIEKKEWFTSDITLLLRQPIYGDTDGDLMPDWWEIRNGLNPGFNDSWGDVDRDGFANIDEYIYNTDSSAKGTHETDYKDHALTFSPYASDKDSDGIGDWWERYFWGSIDACDPSANDDGPTATNPLGDNWTNLQEWRGPVMGEENLYRTVPIFEWTDEFGLHVYGNDTNGDGINDDVDPAPISFAMGPAKHPMNPIAGAGAMNPIFPGDLFGDTDNDGIDNLEEFRRPYGKTSPTDPDSDQDGMPDGWEIGYGKYDNETQKLNIDPLNNDDWWQDFDDDGVNYSRVFNDINENKRKDENETWIVTYQDFDGHGWLNPLWENESFSNFEEYLTGRDVDADGMLENSTDPNQWDSDDDFIPDGYEVYFSDSDRDGLSNWFEILYHLDPNNGADDNGSAGDPDLDGYNNTEEYRNKPNPTNPLYDGSHPDKHGREAGSRDEDVSVDTLLKAEQPETMVAAASTPVSVPPTPNIPATSISTKK